jgi:monoterpene epsilon-lactone hydrolase
MSREQREALRGAIQKSAPGRTPAEERAVFDELFANRPLGEDVTLRPRTLGGVPALDVEVEGADGDGVILYLHGGGYVVGSARTGANLAAQLSRRTGVPAVSLDYRLAPESPFPAAVEDALAAYRELVEHGQTVVLAGDSAGGGLALAMMIAARREGLSLPAAAVVFSPWTDLTLSGASIDARESLDPLFSRAHLAGEADHYLAGQDPSNELASPLLADLTGLPPLLIQVGSYEVLLDDALRLAARAAEYELDVSLDVVAGASHVFPNLVGVLDEAAEALDHAGHFVTRRFSEARQPVTSGSGGGVA